MFSSPKTPAPEPNLAGVKPRRLSTNQQGPPVPIVGGWTRVGSTFLTRACRPRVEPVQGSSGKGKTVTGHDIFCEWAAVHCRGPIDELSEIYLDDQLAWFGSLVRDGTHPDFVDVTISGRGNVRVYWGTETQLINGDLTTYDAGTIHPAYRGQCYSIWGPQFFLGKNKDSIPNAELVVMRYPKPAWFTAVNGAGTTKIEGTPTVNPAAWLADFLQDPIAGPGLPEARIDTASWNAVGEILRTENIGISPIVNRQQSVRQIIAEVFAIIDGYLFLTADGKLGLGLVRAPAGGLTTLDESNVDDAPALNPEAWAETINALSLIYTKTIQGGTEELMQYVDAGNFAITGVTRSKTLQRPWINIFTVAQRVATAAGVREALPALEGSLKTRRSVGKLLTPGTPFNLTWAEQGLSAVTMRVREQTLPAPRDQRPMVTLEFEQDRGYLNADHGNSAAGAAIPPGSEEIEPLPDPVLMEWPWMREFNVPQLAALLARENPASSGFLVHARRPSGTYEIQDYSSRFVMRGEVVDANYPATTNVIDDALGMVVQLEGADLEVELGLPLEDGLLNEWVAVVGGEICSVFEAELLAEGKYRFYLVRGRFDTAREAHAIGAQVFVFRMSDAPLFFGQNDIEEQAMKLQQVVSGGPEDLAGVAEIETVTTQRWWRPLEPKNLRAFGDGMNPVYSTGQDVPIAWTITSERMEGFWEVWEKGWKEELPDTVLEIWTVGGVKVGEVEILFDNEIAPASEYLLDNADLAAWLGGEVSFDVRAYARRNGYRSTRYASLRVTKI